MTDAFLDEVVPRFDDEPPDWDDVLRRARPARRRRFVLVVAIAAAALAAAPAVAVLLTRSSGPQLPSGADRSRVFVVVQPRTGRVLVKAAPWKGHDGFCYVLDQLSGCASRHGRGSVLLTSHGRAVGYTFDDRVASAEVDYRAGRKAGIPFRRLPAPIGAGFFVGRRVLPGTQALVLRDRSGAVVTRFRLSRATGG
ncbi:MAG TPA: hypothetical protein VGF23_05525 [Gaiellaceae bacterium]